MKKLIVLFLGAYAFFYLGQKDLLPSIDQVKNFLAYLDSPLKEESQLESAPSSPQVTNQETVEEQAATSSVPTTATDGKYQATEIQTYLVTVESGKLVVSGKPTPYGKYNQADGVILYIQEQRADKKTTIKVPFKKGKIQYEYPLSYTVGDVIINLDEYYYGKEDDPERVLGYAEYHLTDGDPYLLPSFMVQSTDPGLVALAQNITNGKKTDVEKSKAIFSWVAKNVAYNAPLVNSTNPPMYTSLQAYQSRNVLCSGYAHLSAALHRAVGIKTKVSYGENHAWNEVLLNGVWQAEDPTYGSGFINANTQKFVPHYQPAYFSKTDKQKEGEYPW
ncbi:transglutaminase-like domain-containing protein [Neobacillus drentensis]|uniref:transglutaminase domain-containing protein n=1 Tax=Neobacillus drentensis TaxID=220684 RepID=UPI003000224B